LRVLFVFRVIRIGERLNSYSIREEVRMENANWSKKEKEVSRQTFKRAYERESTELINKVKEMASAAKTPEDIWKLHDFLTEKRNEVDEKYDYRYSVLILVFARLLREGWIELDDLKGLDENKITKIKKML